MEKKVTFQNSFGENLVGYLHIPEGKFKKGIVLAHCFTCSKHQKIMRETCDMLAEQNFLVLRFDFSGNGESEGNFEEATYSKEMKDLGHSISFIISKGVDSVGLIGHSMGAAVSILQSSMDERVKSLCVVSGTSDAASIKEIFPKNKVDQVYSKGKASINLFSKKFEMTKDFFEDTKKHDIKKALSSFNGPFCDIHGDKDEIINVENARKLYSYAKEPKEIHIIRGADHMFSSKESFEELKKYIKVWFKKTCK